MSREIRRLQRNRTQHTNFSSGQAIELPDPTESTDQNIENNSSQPARRQRKRRQNNPSTDINAISSLPNLAESIEQSIDQDSKDAPLANKSASLIGINDINIIRAEFQEDTYHSQLTESDFSDDTHNWTDDDENVSSDYWHFLGRYE